MAPAARKRVERASRKPSNKIVALLNSFNHCLQDASMGKWWPRKILFGIYGRCYKRMETLMKMLGIEFQSAG
jgi:hypothetical protein